MLEDNTIFFLKKNKVIATRTPAGTLFSGDIRNLEPTKTPKIDVDIEGDDFWDELAEYGDGGGFDDPKKLVKGVGEIKIPTGLANKLGDQACRLDGWLVKYADDLGGDATKLLNEVEVFVDNKSIIKVFDNGTNGEVLIQITRADKTNTVVSIQKTAATHPIHKGKYITTKYEPAYKLDANPNYNVPLSKNGITPDFSTTPYLHPLNKGKTIKIEMSGSRTRDFTKANAEMKKISLGFKKKSDYTWHHMDDFYYDAATGKSYCTMQLVERTVHEASGMKHSGSVAQMEKFLGITYK